MVNTASEHEGGRHLKLKLQQPPEQTPQIQDSLVATKLSWDCNMDKGVWGHGYAPTWKIVQRFDLPFICLFVAFDCL